MLLNPPISPDQTGKVRIVLPIVAALAFIALVAIGETEIRHSPNWPPPDRHEVGAWTIEAPKIIDIATGANLPASIPILFAWAHNDAFAEAVDDHRLIVYFPWTLFVLSLWFFVGAHFDYLPTIRSRPSRKRHLILVIFQSVLTLELVYVAAPINSSAKLIEIVSFWIWALLVIAGWVRVIARRTGDAESN